ncbi:MAG: hypothetical protein ACI4XI_07135 [Ruminococcus sp.]
MRIEKTNIGKVTSRIYEYIDSVKKKTNDEKFKSCFDYVLELFACEVEFDTITIDCTKEDVDFLLYDFIRMLAKNHHLALYAFVDRDVEVETVNKLERFRKFCEFFKVTPTGLYDDKIQIHIGFFTCESGEKYDVDLIAKTMLD